MSKPMKRVYDALCLVVSTFIGLLHGYNLCIPVAKVRTPMKHAKCVGKHASSYK